MQYLPIICLFICIICVFITYILFDSTKAYIESNDIKMRDFLKRHLEMIEFKNISEAKMLKLHLSIKDFNDRFLDEEKNSEFYAQEIIRLDRELSKLRPVIRLVKPKGIKK